MISYTQKKQNPRNCGGFVFLPSEIRFFCPVAILAIYGPVTAWLERQAVRSFGMAFIALPFPGIFLARRAVISGAAVVVSIKHMCLIL